MVAFERLERLSRRGALLGAPECNTAFIYATRVSSSFLAYPLWNFRSRENTQDDHILRDCGGAPSSEGEPEAASCRRTFASPFHSGGSP